MKAGREQTEDPRRQTGGRQRPPGIIVMASCGGPADGDPGEERADRREGQPARRKEGTGLAPVSAFGKARRIVDREAFRKTLQERVRQTGVPHGPAAGGGYGRVDRWRGAAIIAGRARRGSPGPRRTGGA